MEEAAIGVGPPGQQGRRQVCRSGQVYYDITVLTWLCELDEQGAGELATLWGRPVGQVASSTW